MEIFHFKGAYQPGWGKLVPQAIELIDPARARGVSIGADMYMYTAGGTGLDIASWIVSTTRDSARIAPLCLRFR